ncbi:MAG: Ig-like domain-containing protein, partial [Limisphaerales bacterium]
FLNVAGQMPQVGFTSSNASSDDTVGTVNIPVTLVLPPGSNSWPANQFIYYWLDRSGTAEYGVDYKMAGGSISFTGGQVPAPYLIPLKILPTGVPGSKTVVIKLGPASSIVNMGPTTTFTYTITNPPAPPPPFTLPNRRPQAQPQCMLVALNTALPITLAGRDGDNDPLTFSITVAPTRGVLSGTAPNLTYTPNSNVSGPDYFCFVVNDGKTNSAPAVVTLAINSSANPPPLVTLLTPGTNAWFVGPTNIVLTASASDADGIFAVELYEGTNSLAQILTPPYTFTWTNPPPGAYTLIAKAYDAGGRRGLSAPVHVRVLGAMPTMISRPATNGMLQFAWPLGVSGATLEESTNLVNWTLVTNILVDTASERTHTVAPVQRRYFRFSVW